MLREVDRNVQNVGRVYLQTVQFLISAVLQQRELTFDLEHLTVKAARLALHAWPRVSAIHNAMNKSEGYAPELPSGRNQLSPSLIAYQI